MLRPDCGDGQWADRICVSMRMPTPLLNPGFRLLVACVDWPGGAAQNDAIVKAVQALDGDWDRFMGLVRRHRIAPLALHGLTSAGIDAPQRLVVQAMKDKRGALSIALEGQRLIAMLDTAGIACIMLKGPLASQQIFADPGMRQCADMDLLVAPQHMEQARRLIGEADYALDGAEPPWGEARMAYWRRGAKDITLRGRKNAIAVELHYRLKNATGLIPGLGLEHAREQVKLASKQMGCFAEADLFAYLSTHGATSLWHRLKWLADIRALLAGKTMAEIEALLDHARGLGVERCAALAMLLCQDLWGQDLPQAVVALRTSDRRLALLEERSLQAVGDLDASLGSIGDRRVATTPFRLRDDWAYYRSVLATILIDPQIVCRLKLPRGLGWLYIPARLLDWGLRRISRK